MCIEIYMERGRGRAEILPEEGGYLENWTRLEREMRWTLQALTPVMFNSFVSWDHDNISLEVRTSLVLKDN